MTCEDAYRYCLTLPHAEACFPFDQQTLVMKVGGRMFAVLPLEKSDLLITKCDPDRAIDLRDAYEGIQPAWHFNKKHWNMIVLTMVPEGLVRELIDHSYQLVISKLPLKIRRTLQ